MGGEAGLLGRGRLLRGGLSARAVWKTVAPGPTERVSPRACPPLPLGPSPRSEAPPCPAPPRPSRHLPPVGSLFPKGRLTKDTDTLESRLPVSVRGADAWAVSEVSQH